MAQIEHVVVLMLENRSFDSMLGRLYEGRDDFNGVPKNAVNVWQDKPYPVWTSPVPLSTDSARIPTPDPKEDFADMTDQIFGTGKKSSAKATMSGFAANYAKTPTHRPGDIMHGFTPEQLPVLSTLAKSFAVCDDWYASAPNQTWPNRFFLHCGTANGYVNNKPYHFPYTMRTVFNLLSDNDRSWGIYYHDMPQAATLSSIWLDLPTHLHEYGTFLKDAQEGKLPHYSFIEPHYFSEPLSRTMPDDQHPPHDVRYGERLIARTYDALRSSPLWKKTLFVILYDEHGGIYDHQPPPRATPPGPPYSDGFHFNRYGVRVPAVVVSPWIRAGTILHRPEGAKVPYDHTSVSKTLREIFSLSGDHLSKREKAAPHFLHALSLPEPTNEGPFHVPLPSINPSDGELDAAHKARPNDHQLALAHLAANLPDKGSQLDEDALESIAEKAAESTYTTVEDALDEVQKGLARFLG